MRPRLSAAVADLTLHATAALSRWTHRVGVADGVRDNDTPTRNAIGLSSPVGVLVDGRVSELSPWHSVLPPPGGGKRQPPWETSS
jgi:hypothetical protein